VLTDTHCHLDFTHYDPDREPVLERAWAAGLSTILVPGIDLSSSQDAVSLTRSQPRVFAAVGVHPNSALGWDEHNLQSLETLATQPKVVAIGEIGLDYYRDRAPKDHQIQVFQQQLELATWLKLPVVIHTRNTSSDDHTCMQDVIRIVSTFAPHFEFPGVFHSYSGNEAEAEQLIALGFYFGVTGPVTYKSAEVLRRVVAAIPLDRLLIETDGPFLTPHPFRGKRNEPAYVRYIAEKISEVHDCTLEAVAEQTSANARQLFRWREVD